MKGRWNSERPNALHQQTEYLDLANMAEANTFDFSPRDIRGQTSSKTCCQQLNEHQDTETKYRIKTLKTL